MNNDRFRFRVWDTRCHEYTNAVDVGDKRSFAVRKDGVLGHLCGYAGDIFVSTQAGRFVIEQCTGLKDENGKLIYEGDVVKLKTGEIGVVDWWNSLAAFKVCFSHTYATSNVQESLEIVGNIHDKEQ